MLSLPRRRFRTSLVTLPLLLAALGAVGCADTADNLPGFANGGAEAGAGPAYGGHGPGGAGGHAGGVAGTGGSPAAGSGGIHIGGAPDYAKGAISIDEKKIAATLDGGTLTIRATATAGAEDAKGKLVFALRSVDGGTGYATATADYAVPHGTSQDFVVSVPVPPGIGAQADWVRYILRITDSASTLQVTRSLSELVTPYEIGVFGPSTVTAGKKASYRIRARDLATGKPLPSTPVQLSLTKGGATVATYVGTTTATGDAIFDVTLASDSADGVVAHAAVSGTQTDVASPITLRTPGSKLLLTTDKPIYQPGQTIHLRALALGEGDDHPLAAQTATFEVEDGKGNKIFKKQGQTDAYGVVATDFAIGPVVNMGDFKTRIVVGDQKSEKTVSVSRYSLPKFKVAVQTDKPWYKAGETVTGSIEAAYFFGKPVAGGDVLVEGTTLDVGQTVFQTAQGKTDANGKFTFTMKLPSSLVGLPIQNGNAAVDLRVTVDDTAKQEVKQDRMVTVSQDGASLVVVPESTVLVPDVENHLDAFAADPLGNPLAGATIELDFADGTKQAMPADDGGHASFTWTPGEGASTAVHAILTPAMGSAITKDFSFNAQYGMSHVVVRTDKAVYSTGETVNVQVLADKPTPTIYVDWINEGQTVDTRALDASAGMVSFTQTVDATLAGSNRIEAYVVEDDGSITRSGRTVFARNQGSLSIAITTDKPQYAPGDPAKVTFSVTDETGAPAVAALGVQVVDEAVYALVDAKPGLLRTYFELEDMFSQPSYEIQGPSADFSDLLFSQTASTDPKTAAAGQTKAAAAFAALGDAVPTGLQLSSTNAYHAAVSTLLADAMKEEKTTFLPAASAAAKDAYDALKTLGCTPQSYYCQATGKDFATSLEERMAKSLQLYDYWGNQLAMPQSWSGFVLQSRGPDELASTWDDQTITYTWPELGLTDMVYPTPGGGGGANGGWDGASGAAGASTGGSTSGGGSEGTSGPKVRKDFPETLYVNPSIITGGDGTATVTVPMADSITTWRVTSLANAANGKLGGATSGITVFQDFFVDISFPATMTRGDEVTFPVAVYNYLQEPQTVTVSLAASPWYTPLGQTSIDVTLAPGEVQGIQIPIHVEQVGVQTLTVKAIGTQKSDAVARMVTVVPDGKEIPSAHSGSLAPGAASMDVSFPADSVPGSPQLHLDVYPAYLSQVVSGMDSLLREPTGCFEQTTSSTWPNVLVEKYMKQTGQITPEIQMKADSLISAGYQRLLTFEHPGGGFSWFGTQDPAPFLSVTAFGVMEFADMSTVRDVDPAMLQRTIDWLASQQKPDGSWVGDQSEFFSFQTSTIRNTAFVTWALSVAGYTGGGLASGLAYVKSQWQPGNEDAYTLGVVANAFVAAAPSDPFTSDLLDQIEAAKKVDGDQIHLDTTGTETSMYGSGNDADVTTTALATEALLVAGGHNATVDGMLAYLSASRDPSGNFGSTQATIWTLRALVLAASKGTDAAVGTLQIDVDGAPFQSVALTADQSDVMHTVDLASLASLGSHTVNLTFAGTGKVGYNLVSKYNVPWADVGPEQGPLSVSVAYDKTTLYVNDSVTETVTVTNNTANTENMVLVTLGIPPGFTVVGDDFGQYLTMGTLSAFETTGKQLNLYIPKIAPNATLTFAYRLTATMPVKAQDGGATVYPYYEPNAKTTAPSTELTAM